MKKKYTTIFIAIAILGTIVIMWSRPAFLFEQGMNVEWNTIRGFIFSSMVGILISGIFFFINEKDRLKPYFKKLYQYRSLLYQLVRRDFKVKYKRSVLGVAWSVLNPLATMLVMTIVFSTIFRFDIENFPVYLLSGQVIFTLFSESTSMCMTSVLGASSLMKKVNVPKYIFPLSKALSSLVNFGFSLISLLLVMIVTQAPFHLAMLGMVLPVFYVFIFSLGIGMQLAAIQVFFRDVSYLYGILITVLSYLTPLFYPISIIPDRFRWLISINPIYHLVECFRTVTIYGGMPSAWQNIVCGLLSILSLGIGVLVFYRKQDQFILYI